MVYIGDTYLHWKITGNAVNLLGWALFFTYIWIIELSTIIVYVLKYLVDPASSYMLVSKIKPCMSKYKLIYFKAAYGSLKQL